MSLPASAREAEVETAKPRLRVAGVAVLLAATIIIYVLPAGRAILDDGDALYAQVAAGMVSTGDWVTPRADGVRFLDKPPLLYWLIGVSYLLFGVSEWAARLPAAAAIFLTALLICRLGARGWSERSGLIAGLAFTLSAGTLFFTLEAFPDIFLVLFLTLALSCFLEWYLGQPRGSLPAVIGFFAALAGAALAKGLIGILFPVATAAIFLLGERAGAGAGARLLPGRLRLRPGHLLIGVAVFLALVLPWHIAAAERNAGFIEHYFINEQVMRFLGRREPVDYVSIPVPIFWLLVPVWLFPWSAFLPAAWRMKSDGREGAAVARLAWCWAGVVIGFFTFSSRLEHYSFPALPPLAIVAGVALGELRSRWVERAFAGLALLGAILGLMAVSIAVWWAVAGADLLSGAEMSARDRAYTNLFSPLFELPASTRASLVLPLIAALAVCAAGLIAAWWFERRGRRWRAVGSMAAMMVIFGLMALYSLGLCEGMLSSKAFGLALKREAVRGARVVVMGDYETANSIGFYARVQLLMCEGSAASIERGLRDADAPEMIISRERLKELWKGEEQVFLLAARERLAELGLGSSRVVIESAGRVLTVNR